MFLTVNHYFRQILLRSTIKYTNMLDSNWKYKLILFSWFFIFLFANSDTVYAENAPSPDEGEERHALEFIPNLNQYQSEVKYSVGLGNLDKLFLTENGFTYIFHNNDQVEELHDIMLIRDPEAMKNYVVDGHVYNIDFIGADLSKSKGIEPQKHKYNYFRGKDPNNWASNVPAYHETEFQDIYSNIDMKVYSHDGLPKYDFIISPGGRQLDYSNIHKYYNGGCTYCLPIHK